MIENRMGDMDFSGVFFVCLNTSRHGSGVLFVDYGWHFEHLQVYS
jgi:hypothetical protein